MRSVLLIVPSLLGPAALAAQPAPVWTLEPEVSIGTADHGRSILAAVTSMVVDPTTREVYVPQQAAILVFDRDGGFVRTLERRVGLNPAGATVGWADGRLTMTETVGRRVSYYTAAGDLVETRQLDVRPRPDDSTPLLPMAAAPGGALIVLDSHSYDAYERLLRLSPTGESVLLQLLDNRNRMLRIGDTFIPQPLPWHSHFAVHPAGTEIVVVHQEEPTAQGPATFEVRRIRTNGEVLFSRSYEYTPRPVNGQAIVEGLLARWAGRSMTGVPRLNPEALRERYRIPRFDPAVTSVALGVDGTVWLRREEHEREPERALHRGARPTERAPVWWEVLDPQGERIGQLQIHASSKILHVDGEEVWGVERDEVGDVRGVRFRVHR